MPPSAAPGLNGETEAGGWCRTHSCWVDRLLWVSWRRQGADREPWLPAQGIVHLRTGTGEGTVCAGQREAEKKWGHCEAIGETALGVLHFSGWKSLLGRPSPGSQEKEGGCPCDSVSLSPARLASSPQNEAELRKREPSESQCASPVFPPSPSPQA